MATARAKLAKDVYGQAEGSEETTMGERGMVTDQRRDAHDGRETST